MLDRKDIQKQIEDACLETRTDPFEDKFKSNDAAICHGIIYQDLKIDSEQKLSQLELFGKPIKKLRLVTGQIRKDNKYIWNGAALYIHYEDRSKVTKTINPEKYDEIFRLFENHGAKKEYLFSDMDVYALPWEQESVEDIYKNKSHDDPYKTYKMLHEKIASAMLELAELNKLSEINVIDAGCGEGNFLELLQRKAKEKGIKINLVGFDVNLKNIRRCEQLITGDNCHFLIGNSMQLDEVFTQGYDNKWLQKNRSTFLVFSGSLTRFVTNNSFEAANILQQAALNNVDYVLGGGHTIPLLNQFMKKRIGFKDVRASEIKHEERFFYALRQLAYYDEILTNKINKIKNRNFLDLTLSPNPGKILKDLDDMHNIHDGLTIDLSFSVLSPQLEQQLNNIAKKYPKIKLICWHWDKLFLDTLREKFSNQFAKIETRFIHQEAYLMGPRAFFQSLQPLENKDTPSELNKYIDLILIMNDVKSIESLIEKKPELEGNLFFWACWHKPTPLTSVYFLLQKNPELAFKEGTLSRLDEAAILSLIALCLAKDERAILSNILVQWHHSLDYSKVIKILEEEKINPAEIKSSDGQSLLHVMAKSGRNLEEIEYVSKKNPELVNAQDDKGQTPFYVAINSRNEAIIHYFLKECPADIDLTDKNGANALHYAVEKENYELIETLLKRDKSLLHKPDNEGRTPFHYAAKKRNMNLIRKFEQLGVDVNLPDKKGYTGLEIAIMSRDYYDYNQEKLTNILNYYASKKIDFSKNPRLVEAVTEGHDYTTAVWLHEKGVDFSSLFDSERINNLIESDAGLDFFINVTLKFKPEYLYHPQKNHPSLLHLAVERDDWEYPFLEKLVKHNVNLNFPDQNGNTPAHIVMKKHQGGQRILMENKVDWSVQNNEGNTPLHLAFENNSEFINDLIKRDWKLLFIANHEGAFPLQHTLLKNIDSALDNLEKLLIDDIAKNLSSDDKKSLLENLLVMRDKISVSLSDNSPGFFSTSQPIIGKKIVYAIDQWVQSPIFTLHYYPD